MLPNPLDFHRICRICFSNSEHLTNLFECEIDFVNLLVSMTKLSIHANDDLPQNICPFCSHQIKSMHYFILKCQESDGKLRSSLKTSLVTKNEEEPSNNVQFSDVNSSFDSVYDQIESQPEVKEQRNQKLTRRKNGKNHMGTEQSVGSVKPVCTGRSYKKTIAHTGKRSDQMENIAPTSRNKSESSTKPQNVCCVCNKTFANANNLGRHQLLHQNDKTNQQFQCKVCGKQMKHVNHYKMHMRSHRDSVECSIVDEKPMAGNKKQFMCSTCGRICTSRSNLAVHIRRHTGTMTNFCKICGKGYPRSTDLTIHMRKHTGEKPFLCTICNRGFARSDKLTIHIRTHTGEKPYACTTCTRGFAQRNDLISHQRRNVCGSASDKTENNETAQYTTIQIMTT